MLLIVSCIVLTLALAGVVIVNHPAFGRAPRAERLERIRRSPNYRDGAFRNLQPTARIVSRKGFVGTMLDFFFNKPPRLYPQTALPAEKVDLHDLDRDEDVLVWFGHSSCFIQLGGKRILLDPVLSNDLPMSLMFRPFKGMNVYTPEIIPPIDYLVVTHDHMDHLDYRTVRELRERISRVVCPLGVGEHLERWGFDPSCITEMDWDQTFDAGDGFSIHCLPARHFSGRGLHPNSTLWASFMLETPTRRIFLAGDGGYDTHFAQIGRRFAPIDLAILENGQYNPDWRSIHCLPEQLVQAIRDLAPERVMTVHHSKFALSKHPWDEPMKTIAAAARNEGFRLVTPKPGERVHLADTTQRFSIWWENIK